MSATTSHSKPYSYNSSPHKTPKLKDISSASCSYPILTKDSTPHPTIIMDEYGQTPDHYYLAKKAPATFYQVKRKLDLQTFNTSKMNQNPKTNQRRLRKKANAVKINKNTTDKPRYDTSLGQLTKKFLRLLADATDGVINLNTACALLAVPKRRLYDITNVLEGAGLIQKTSRNLIQWMGRVSSPCASLRQYELEREIDILEAKENKLDELIYHMKQQVNSIKEKDENYLYVTGDDLKSIEEFSSRMLIGVNMSPGVQMIESTDKTLIVSSKSTEIEACLLCDDVSFVKVISPQYESPAFETYSVRIEKNNFILSTDKSILSEVEISTEKVQSPAKISENDSASPDLGVGSVWTEFLEGDPVIRNAFITEEDDIAPMGKHFLLQTEDQDLDDFLPFQYLENSIDAYSFSLDVGEGLTDLYDCGYPSP